MKLYKYSKQKYAIGMARYGNFRIGTLHEYRSSEHVKGISDATEGTKMVIGEINEHYATGADVPKNLEHYGIIKVDNSSTNITFSNVRFTSKVNADNAYIWCASIENSSRVQHSFEGTTHCVEIINVKSFINEMSAHMSSIYNAVYRGLHVIEYVGRDEQWLKNSMGRYPGVIKDSSFAVQKEIRAIWQPTSSRQIEPVTGKLPGLAKYCRLVRIKNV